MNPIDYIAKRSRQARLTGILANNVKKAAGDHP